MSKTVLSKIGALLLPLIFSVFCAFPSFAQTENTVTIQAKDIALEKVMQQIEKQTRCVFLNKDVDVKENVSVNISGKTLSETLKFYSRTRISIGKSSLVTLSFPRRPLSPKQLKVRLLPHKSVVLSLTKRVFQ